MKMTYLSGIQHDESVHITVDVEISGVNVSEATAQVAALFTAAPSSLQQAPLGPNDPSVSEPVVGTSPQTGTEDPAPRRRRRTAAEMAEANSTHGSKELDAEANAPPTDAQAPVADTASTEPVSRRRRTPTTPPASPDPMPINDAEMSKAASNAAEELVKLGEDGPGIVMLVLKDFEVTSASDIPQEKRQKFIEELAKEVTLAKAEKAPQA